MRRFFVWSALSALIGLILAVGGYLAYQHFYGRFQPVTVTRNQKAIQDLLDEASWLSAGGGGEPLYIIGYRDSAAMQRYEREEAPKLRAAGVEVRIVVFARADREGLAQSTAAERATVAPIDALAADRDPGMVPGLVRRDAAGTRLVPPGGEAGLDTELD